MVARRHCHRDEHLGSQSARLVQPQKVSPCLKGKETDMGHSVGDGIIVAAIAVAFVAYLYFRHIERQRRLEIVHQERLAAMDKGIPLPEFPLDPPKVPRPPDPRAPLIHGIVWLTLGGGAMLALRLIGPQENLPALWPLPLPIALLGLGLMLYYALVSERSR
jgi:hypothetical protein